MVYSEGSKEELLKTVLLAAQGRLNRRMTSETNIRDAVDVILELNQSSPERSPQSSEQSSQLLERYILGVSRIYSRQASDLVEECNNTVTRLRESAHESNNGSDTSNIDLPENERVADFDSITHPLLDEFPPPEPRPRYYSELGLVDPFDFGAPYQEDWETSYDENYEYEEMDLMNEDDKENQENPEGQASQIIGTQDQPRERDPQGPQELQEPQAPQRTTQSSDSSYTDEPSYLPASRRLMRLKEITNMGPSYYLYSGIPRNTPPPLRCVFAQILSLPPPGQDDEETSSESEIDMFDDDDYDDDDDVDDDDDEYDDYFMDDD